VNHPRILGIGTANPPVRLTQEQSFHAAGYKGERIRKIFLNSDIDYRHFFLEGALSRKILDLNPEMVGAVLDMPVTIETVNQKLNGNTRGGRCAYIAGDFFDSVPVGAHIFCAG